MNYTQFKHVVVLTGAGVSAESGIPTFRGKDGLWTQKEMEYLARPETFRQDPEKVHAFYNQRRLDLKQSKPNRAHNHIAYMQDELAGSPTKMTLVTQNVDDLHEKAGTKDVIHLHGELNSALCTKCQSRMNCDHDLTDQSVCKNCQSQGALRPDIVWFGEIPYHLDEVQKALLQCDMFVSIGTSGSVFPAADFVNNAKQNGAFTVELNLTPSENAKVFDHTNYGLASQIVPNWIDTFIHGP